MKKNTFNYLFVGLLATATLFTSCKKDETTDTASKLPTTFKVAIPTSLSRTDLSKSLRGVDTLKGNDIYRNLNNFIYVGDKAAEVVQAIIASISKNNINKAMDLTYTSNEDGRLKHLVVIENSSYDNVAYQFQLTITDKSSEGLTDGGKALQVFWNTNPIKGVAIIKPYNCDRVLNATSGNAMYRVDYSEETSANYDAQMTVYIANWPMLDSATNQYTMRAMKMFVGRRGNYVDVYGNSAHPHAKFINTDEGFDWAFVASGNHSVNYATAEVGLPSYTLNSTDRKILLEDYSVKNVLTNQCSGYDPALVAAFLTNTTAPGYFNSNGFIKGGTAPNAEYTNLYNRTKALSPYNPKEINEMVIAFK